MSKASSLRANASGLSLGCIVVLETGARWPRRAFASVPYRDGVVVLRESPDEPINSFMTRLKKQCSLLGRSGVKFIAAIVACGEPGKEQARQRRRVVSAIRAQVFAGSEGDVILA